MKSTSGINEKTMSDTERAKLFAIRKTGPLWSVTIHGQQAKFKHQKGALYVAYLLLNPPEEPIHGAALELKANAFFREAIEPDAQTTMENPFTGEIVTIPADAELVQHNLLADEKEGRAYLHRKVRELEAILDQDNASEPVKAEVQRELEELYAYQGQAFHETKTMSQNAVRAVRWTLKSLHKDLATGLDANENWDVVIRIFASHIQNYILIPSARYQKTGRHQSIARASGCFTYEPPLGIKWNA
jgi:hypothetical protein